MTSTTENLRHTHVCVWPNMDRRKVVLLNDDGETGRVTWNEHHDIIPGQGGLIRIDDVVPLDWLIPLEGES